MAVAGCAVISVWINAFQGNWSTVSWAVTSMIWIGLHIQAIQINDMVREDIGMLQEWVKKAKLTDAMKMERIANALKDEIALQGTEDFILMKNDEVRKWWFETEEK